MANYLAVDWDATELRLVLASSQRGSIRILKAESAPLELGEGTDEAKTVDIGLTLKHLLKRHKIPHASLLLGLNRAAVDMMTFQLPKSKPEELPDLVKNQALRDSPGFSETSPIDFITSPSPEGEHVRTIAATISRAQLKQYRVLCQASGFRARRIEFRPLALAELHWNSNAAINQPVLLVQCTASEIDMVVVEEANVMFVRSIKLPESLADEERTLRIVSEIARTIAVSRQEVEGAVLEKVILYGDADAFKPLQERLTDQEIETTVQNPFQLNCVSAPARANITGVSVNPGHYAALFGMILSEQSKSPMRIDFLHPREKPQPLNIARFVALFLLLVGIIGYGAWAWNSRSLAQLNTRLAELKTDITELETERQQLYPTFRQLTYANAWENGQMIWLDELRDISVRLPDEQDLVVDQMRFIGAPNFFVDLKVRVRDTTVLQQIIARFNDGFHRVMVHDQQPNSQRGGGYPVSCSLRIFYVNKRYGAGYTRFLSPELQQASNIAPDFPKNEPPREATVTTPDTATQTTPTAAESQNAESQPDVAPRDKPAMKHVFAREYSPKPASTDADETPAKEKVERPHVQPPEYSPKPQPEANALSPASPTATNDKASVSSVKKAAAQHVLPIGYVPLASVDNGKATTENQKPPQRQVYPGGYLPKDALEDVAPETEAGNPDAEAAAPEGGAA